MVGKLLKHELIALFRVLGFIAVAVFGFAVLGRIVIAINSETVFGFLLILFYLFAIMTLIVAAFVLGISQFYKSLFTGSGYMTLSLPATADQIIWAKLLSSVIAMFFASAVSLLSATVFLVGIPSEFWAEFWASIQPLLDTISAIFPRNRSLSWNWSFSLSFRFLLRFCSSIAFLRSGSCSRLTASPSPSLSLSA